MLTPVDIQQKKFHIGLGYDKKDVNTFFEAVAESYEKLYRSNAELKEKVVTLTDGLQHYKSKESALEKSLMLAEKDSEDTKSKANREAKNIELDAKNKAKVIVADAEARLEKLQQEIAVLETQYAAYKSNFSSLLKQQFGFLQENDFDVDAYIDDKALTLLGGSAPSSGSSGDSFGSFTGDPQMRDESTLGGMSGPSSEFGSGDNLTSTSAVYTSNLGANENFVDPFSPKEENGRYNPYDGRTADKSSKTGGQSFKVSDKDDKKKYKRTPVAGKAANSGSKESASTPSVGKGEKKNAESSEDTKSHHKAESIKAESKSEAKPTGNTDKQSKAKPVVSESIPTVNLESVQPEAASESEDELIGDVEVQTNEQMLIGDGTETDDDSKDEFGFEFV